MLGKEVQEFTAVGVDEMKRQVKDLDEATQKLRKSNKQLHDDIQSGAWSKEAARLGVAKRQLEAYNREQKVTLQYAQKTALVQKYGVVGGNARYYANGVPKGVAGVGGAAKAIGGSALGMAATLGAGLGIGALASRGFQGTAAAAKLDMQMERLSRHVATTLLPVMEMLSKGVGRVNDALDRGRAGTASRADQGYNVAAYGGAGAALGLGGLGLANAAGFRPATYGVAAARGIGSYAMQAGSFMGKLAGIPGVGLDFATTTQGAKNNIDRVRERAAGAGLTESELETSRDIIENGSKITDAAQRKSYYRQMSAKAAARERELQEKNEGRNFLNKALHTTLYGTRERSEMRAEATRSEVAGRLALADNTQGKKGNEAMMLVQGAGERRSSGDLYEELASTVAQKLVDGGKPGEGTGESVAEVVGKIYGWLLRRFPD